MISEFSSNYLLTSNAQILSLEINEIQLHSCRDMYYMYILVLIQNNLKNKHNACCIWIFLKFDFNDVKLQLKNFGARLYMQYGDTFEVFIESLPG